MPDLVNADVKTLDPAPSKLCADCANHGEQDEPVTGTAWHFCTAPKLVDLVTGKSNPTLSCDVQRAGSGTHFCGADASFFEAQEASS